MPKPHAPPAERRPAGADVRGIHAVRRSLGFGEREEGLVRDVGPLLAPRLAGITDRFYTRLLGDPVAQRILTDEAQVLRLKRTLIAWCDEMLTLPHDEDYERARARIGQAHVEIELSPYLMVTAMSGIRSDLCSATRELLAGDPAVARETRRAVGLVCDLDLALMLEAYRREERKVIRRKDRALYAERAMRLHADNQRDRLDAALCHVELAASKAGNQGDRHLVHVRDLLRDLARPGRTGQSVGSISVAEPTDVELLDLCEAIRDQVSFDPRTWIRIKINPPSLQIRVHAEAVRLAIEELLENAATHGAGGEVVLSIEGSDSGGMVQIQVADHGVGWGPGIRQLSDLSEHTVCLGLSFCELVADLHRGTLDIFDAEGGGAGVTLSLQTPVRIPRV